MPTILKGRAQPDRFLAIFRAENILTMILDRIIKGFWGRYFFYLSVFVAVYLLMRNAIDNALYSLGSLLFGQLEGCHNAIAWGVLVILVVDPIYRKYTRKVTVVYQPLFAFVLVPVSAWYTFQILVPQTEKYILFDLLYKFILFTTLAYSNIIAFEKRGKRPNKKNSSSLLKDEPINRDSKDELGFTVYADSISSNIIGIVGNERSFVFGIEGSWGSGKTSFINMVKERLKKHKEIRIVDFNPWMSSSSKQITTDFFKRMTEEVSDMQLKAKFREYGKLLAAADKTGIIEKVVDRICTSQDLGTMLESINYCIEREKLRFVVFIDDTDRLDKEELLAMFKLVRNTANFRNTVFVLTYDREYVETVLQKYFDDERTAKAYPDKIVNFQFELPSSTKTYYEILKEKINHSEFIKAHPEIRLNDGDLPNGITALFDSYRKVKRIFNACIVDDGFPHFEKIPIKYTLVFIYISYYRKEEYEMIKEAYHAVNNTNCLKEHKIIGESIGQSMWRYIHESKGIYGTNFDNFNKSDNEPLNEKEKGSNVEVNRFKDTHLCVHFLLTGVGKNPFVKYMDFLLKVNAIHYKEYKERYETYGIDGYKDIKLELSEAESILNRLTVISMEFPKTFYEESVNELLELFTRGVKKDVEKKELKQYYKFLFCLLLNSSNPYNYSGILIRRIHEHYVEYRWNGIEILNFLNCIGDLSQTNNSILTNYFTNFTNDKKYNLASTIYREILYNLIKPRLSLPYEKENVLMSVNRHLQSAIDNELDYDTIEFAFLACYDRIDQKIIYLSNSACSIFRDYIRKFPDDFIKDCIRKLNGYLADEYNIILHPFLMQIFSNTEEEVIEYFKHVNCKTERSKFMLSMIQKYLDTYLSKSVQNSEFKIFQIEKEDYERIFNYTDNEATTEDEFEPIEQLQIFDFDED